MAAVSEEGSENDAGDEAETQPRQTRQHSKAPTTSTAHLSGPLLSVRHPLLPPLYHLLREVLPRHLPMGYLLCLILFDGVPHLSQTCLSDVVWRSDLP